MIEYDLRNAERDQTMIAGSDPAPILSALQAAVADGGASTLDLILLEYHPATQAEHSIEGIPAIEAHLQEHIKIRAQSNIA